MTSVSLWAVFLTRKPRKGYTKVSVVGSPATAVMKRALRCLSTAFLISSCMDVGSAGFQCAVFQHGDLSRVRRSTPPCSWRAFTSTARKSVDRLGGTLRLRGGNSSQAPGGRVASDTGGQGHIDALQVDVLNEGIELEARSMQQERSVGDTLHTREFSANRMFTYS